VLSSTPPPPAVFDRSALDALGEVVADRIRRRDPRPGAALVGVTGSVAVGKTTTAEALAAYLRTGLSARVAVVSTDGFLYSNAELRARSLLDRKGFPETFDVDRLAACLSDLAVGAEGVDVPVYSHLAYDIVASRRVEPCDIAVIEGLHLLTAPVVDRLDVSIYLEASDSDLERWFIERVLELRAAARDQPDAYLHALADDSDDAVTAMASAVWRHVNLPNLHQHIRPPRPTADIVVEFGPQHDVVAVRTHGSSKHDHR